MPGTPLLVLCADPGRAVRARALGALATLVAPLSPVALREELDRAMQIAAATRATATAAGVDPLTGLAGPEHMAARLDSLAGEASRAGETLYVIVLKLVDLEGIQRSHGRVVAELAVEWAAAQLRAVADRADPLARTAEDALTWALPGRTGPEADQALGMLRNATAQARPRLGAVRVPVATELRILDASAGSPS
jgi:GGDEF domain-containing protein